MSLRSFKFSHSVSPGGEQTSEASAQNSGLGCSALPLWQHLQAAVLESGIPGCREPAPLLGICFPSSQPNGAANGLGFFRFHVLGPLVTRLQ